LHFFGAHDQRLAVGRGVEKPALRIAETCDHLVGQFQRGEIPAFLEIGLVEFEQAENESSKIVKKNLPGGPSLPPGTSQFTSRPQGGEQKVCVAHSQVVA